MKIVFDDGECSITKTPMAFACCDKCDKPSHFSLGFINEPLKNQWDKEEHKYCEHCGALMDWDSLDIPKAIESYEEKIRADERRKTLDEYIEKHKKDYLLNEWEKYIKTVPIPMLYSRWLAEQLKE